MLTEQFVEIIESLKSGDLFKIKQCIDQISEDNFSSLSYSSSDKRFKEAIEKNYYITLSKLLASEKFEDFRQLLNYSDKLGIFIDVKRIPFRFEIISDLHLNCIQSGQSGNIFDIIKFYNDYDLFDRDFTNEELEFIKNIKKDKILIANLNDLFGKVTDALNFYSCKIMPYDLYLIFLNNSSSSALLDAKFISRNYFNLSFLLKYFDRYSMYGLSIEKLGDINSFIEVFEKKYLAAKNNIDNKDLKLIEFSYGKKTHLVSVNNILKNYDKILGKKGGYNFCSLSMVLLGGIGPQGHGFTYSTPKGEVVEICSDIKENEAIIIKYKEFLREQFLIRLRKEMTYKNIDSVLIQKIIDYLLEIINKKEIINYYKKDLILKQIVSFLSENLRSYDDLIKKISNAIKVILRPIKMKDQFKTRMYLVDENKIRSEDIAKLTSLKDKSHYDVLRERCFFQNEIKWFFQDYANEILKFGEEFL